MAIEMHFIFLVFATYFICGESTVKSSKMKVDFGINLPSMSFNIPSMGMPKMQITAIVGRKKPRKPIKLELPQISLHAKSLEDPWSNQNEGQYNNQGGSNYDDSGYQEDNYDEEGYDSDKENDDEGYEGQGQGGKGYQNGQEYQSGPTYGQNSVGGGEYRPSGNVYQQGTGGYAIKNNGYNSEGGYQQANNGYQSSNIQAGQYNQINRGYSGKNNYQASNGGYGGSVYKLGGDGYQASNSGNGHSNGRYHNGNQMYLRDSYRIGEQPIRNNVNVYNPNHGMPSNQYQANGVYNDEAISYRPPAPNSYHLVPLRNQVQKPYGNSFPNYGGGHADYNQEGFRQNNYISDNSIEYSNSNGYNSYTGQDYIEPKNYAKDKEVIVYNFKPKKVKFVDQHKNYGANKYYKRTGAVLERNEDRYQASNHYKRSSKLETQSGWKPVNIRY